ncbi:MAG: response regulator, partial [Nitrospinota bacterium]
MPEMDGLEATQIIRNSNPSTLQADIPIIAMSAFSGEEDKTICLQAGMDDHVSKPVDREKLFAVVKKLLPPQVEK